MSYYLIFIFLFLNLALALCAAILARKFFGFLKNLSRNVDDLKTLVWDGPLLQKAVQPSALLPQPGGWAASIDLLMEIVRLIEERRPEKVVELGSGLSTVVIALKLKNLGFGKLISIDHDGKYASVTKSYLAAHGVSDIVEMRIAPLSRRLAPDSEVPWYDTAQLTGIDDIDMLIVDGPPRTISPLARKPTFSFFRPFMRGDWIMVLDDANREGERAIIQEWALAAPELKIVMLPLSKGAALISLARRSSDDLG